VPFQYGSGWGDSEQDGEAAVVVISSHLNQILFGGGNSVGKTVRIDDHNYRVVGVLRDWNPQPEFFANLDYPVDPPDIFLPFQYAVANRVIFDVYPQCKRDADSPGVDFAALLRSNCMWLSYMAELDDAVAVQRYRAYLDAYANEQQQLGRFQWGPNNRLRDVMATLDHEHVVSADTRVSLLVAQGLLVVCLVNTVGLLLAKFLRRSGEIAVRRALGASRLAVYAQFLTEAGLIGLGGGLLGVGLTALGVLGVRLVMSAGVAAQAHFDTSLFVLTLTQAVVATVLAGVYPSYRATRVPPGLQLKAP
jgi:putative ABC transport system permease protein